MYRSRSQGCTLPKAISYLKCPAKTYTTNDGIVSEGHNVYEHCKIVGEVAKELLSRLPSDFVQSLFPKEAPLIAAAHDVGKVSPCFVDKIRKACAKEPISSFDPNLDAKLGGHSAVSQVTIKELSPCPITPDIVGQHHGFSPAVGTKKASDEIFGGLDWQKERKLLTEELKRHFGMEWPLVSDLATARVLAGLTTVSDWIGSGEYFYDPNVDWAKSIEKQWMQQVFFGLR